MSEETLIDVYRNAYWRKNELQIIICDFPSVLIQDDIDRYERIQARAVEFLGFVPAV